MTADRRAKLAAAAVAPAVGDREAFHERNRVECLINRLKLHHAGTTRDETLAEAFSRC